MYAKTGAMRLSLTREMVVVDDVYCQECDRSVGRMTVETLWEALRIRGNILCPECRELKCDYCGLLGSRQGMNRVEYPQEKHLIFRRCYWCTHEGRYAPEYWYHGSTHHAHPAESLSSSPYLNKLHEKDMGKEEQTADPRYFAEQNGRVA